MKMFSDQLARMSAMRRGARTATPADETLGQLAGFGSNPGGLVGKIYLPENLAAHAPLVVVMHGCTQTAAGYANGTGWTQQADRHGFALLLPEQQRQNNPNLCFNWFSPPDTRRDSGEALSIRQMIATMVERHRIDPVRIFVTGLSAGGAMTSVMLATYPEVFAGGAIIAGLPYGAAATIPQALERMRGQAMPDEVELGALVRAASPHQGPWPTISVWHGSGDATVNPNNADAIIAQWRTIHGLAVEPTRSETVDGYPRRAWCNASGAEVIEEYSITGMGHGTPLDTACGDGCGTSGAFMLEASISSTQHICRYWGLAKGKASGAKQAAPAARPESRTLVSDVATAEPTGPILTRIDLKPRQAEAGNSDASPSGTGPQGVSPKVGKVIEDALRAAGLMR